MPLPDWCRLTFKTVDLHLYEARIDIFTTTPEFTTAEEQAESF